MIMPETPKKKRDVDNQKSDEKDSWREDQKERGYYYDDAHGYEVYVPEEDDDRSESCSEAR